MYVELIATYIFFGVVKVIQDMQQKIQNHQDFQGILYFLNSYKPTLSSDPATSYLEYISLHLRYNSNPVITLIASCMK